MERKKKTVTWGRNNVRTYTPTKPRNVIRNTKLKRQKAMSKRHGRIVGFLVKKLEQNRAERDFLNAQLRALRRQR